MNVAGRRQRPSQLIFQAEQCPDNAVHSIKANSCPVPSHTRRSLTVAQGPGCGQCRYAPCFGSDSRVSQGWAQSYVLGRGLQERYPGRVGVGQGSCTFYFLVARSSGRTAPAPPRDSPNCAQSLLPQGRAHVGGGGSFLTPDPMPGGSPGPVPQLVSPQGAWRSSIASALREQGGCCGWG